MTAEQPADRVSLDLLLAHRDWVRALARRLVLDENDADDVEQETWRMAVEKPPRHAESLRAWLGTVVRNAARMSGRRSSRRTRHETVPVERAPTPSPEDLVAAAELQARLARAVLDLDEPYRSTVLYRFHEGLEASEIAARLGVPVETVRTRLKRAIERLRERMDVELSDDRDAWCLLLVGMKAADAEPFAAPPATAVVAASGGGLAMSAGAKLVVAAAAVVVAGLASWRLWFDGHAPARAEGPTTASAPVDGLRRAAPHREPRSKAAAVAESTPPAPAAAAAPVPQIPFGPFDVHGRVIDDDTGAPVAKVVVSLVNEFADRPVSELSATTRDDGTFRVYYPGYAHYDEFLLHAEGYPEQMSEVPWRARGAALKNTDSGDIRIYRGRRVAGRVLAADGRTPVAGAKIRLSTLGAMSTAMWIRYAVERGTSRDDGTFSLDRVPPSHTSYAYTVFAVAPAGVGWTKLAGDAGRADATGVDVVLRPTGAATVTVRDEAGAPQADVQVVASPRFEPLGPSPDWDVGHDAYVGKDGSVAAVFASKTDAQGAARFTSLPTVEERPRYDLIAYGKTGTRAWKRVSLPAGSDAAVEIVLPAPRKWAIAGVVHGADGTPVAGAFVKGGYSPTETRSGADGRFRIEGLDPLWEEYWFTVTAEGCATVQRAVKPEAKTDVVEVDIVVERATAIDGRIVDQDGKPIEGAYVDLIRSGQGAPSITTGADGRFEFADVAPGEWTLRHHAPQPNDEWASGEDESPAKGGDRGIVVVLHRVAAGNARLVAEVVDADTGAPLAPDEVMLLPAAEDQQRARSSHGKSEVGSGRVTIERVHAGRWRLWVRVSGRVPAVAGIEVREGQTEVAARVKVGRAGTLRGRVELGDWGAPLPPMLSLGLADEWTSPQWATYRTDRMIGAEHVQPDGTFLFKGVMPARYRFESSFNGFIYEGAAEVPSGGEGTVVITVTQAASLSFRLAAASPSDVVQYEASKDGGPWRCIMRFGGEKGKTPTFDATLRPGAYRWRVTFPADDFSGSTRVSARTAEGEVTVAAGETAVVDVPVAPK